MKWSWFVLIVALVIMWALGAIASTNDGILKRGIVGTATGPKIILQLCETNGMYSVLYNPNATGAWQLIYSTTNYAQAVDVFKQGQSSATNTP